MGIFLGKKDERNIMNIAGVVKMIWNKITGKDVSADVLQAETRIDVWRSVYKGEPAWLEYRYPTLKGVMQKRMRKSINPAKIVCSEIAGLVWTERPEITTEQGVLDVLENNGFFKVIQRETEYMLALGATIPKLYVDENEIKLDWVQADRFIPVSWDSTGIHEADIIDRRVVNSKQYVRIEKHRKAETGYTITSEAYECVGDSLVPCSLTVFGMDEAVYTSPTKMFFYLGVPEANNLDTDSPLSNSCYANALDTFECIVVAYDALNSEVLLGKKRIIVPAGAVRHVIGSEGKAERYFDPTDEVFQAFSSNDKDELKITDNSVELRVDEIISAIKAHLDILCIQLGLSVGTLSFDGQSMKTATEVISESSKTFKTKQTYENAIGDMMLEMFKSIRVLLAVVGTPVKESEDSIQWNDSVIEDRNSKTAYIHSRIQGGTMPKYRAIMELDGVDEAEARTRAQEIKDETATVGFDNLLGGIG
jgi:A118 family predicted phage portal protein